MKPRHRSSGKSEHTSHAGRELSRRKMQQLYSEKRNLTAEGIRLLEENDRLRKAIKELQNIAFSNTDENAKGGDGYSFIARIAATRLEQNKAARDEVPDQPTISVPLPGVRK